MRVTVRPRTYPDGRVVWTADVHVQPAGEARVDRFRVTAPPAVTSKSGADRWAMDLARRIAAEGRPANTKRARAVKLEQLAAEQAARIPTFGEFWPTFRDHIIGERLKPGTIDTYDSIARLKLQPLFAETRLDAITEIDVQRLKSKMRDAAAAHVNSTLRLLARVLVIARIHYPALPVVSIKNVRKEKGEHVRFYSPEQAAALVAAAQDDDRLVTLLLALDAGLRASEVHALRWVDVDLANRELTVNHTIYRGQLLLPKSGRSRRVPLTRRLADALAQLGHGGAPWVLPRVAHRPGSKFDGTPVHIKAVLRRLARAVGVPDHGPHSLRHTFACLLLAAGAGTHSNSGEDAFVCGPAARVAGWWNFLWKLDFRTWALISFSLRPWRGATSVMTDSWLRCQVQFSINRPPGREPFCSGRGPDFLAEGRSTAW